MRIIIILAFYFAFPFNLFAQQRPKAFTEYEQRAYCEFIGEKFQSLNKRLFTATRKALAKSQKQEMHIYRKLLEHDTTVAQNFLKQSNDYYSLIKQKLQLAEKGFIEKKLKEYNQYFDTIKTALSFLQLNNETKPDKSATTALVQLKHYETSLQTINEIKRQQTKRSQELTKSLSQLPVLRQLNKIREVNYGLKQQLEEYKGLLKDRKKIETFFLAKLRNDKAFSDFVKKNSILAKMFPITVSPATSGDNLQGLQTIASVQAEIIQRFGNSQVNPQQYLNQQVNVAQSELNDLKSKLDKGKLREGSDPDMPKGYNSQRTKSLLKRVTYEANFQTQRQQVTMSDISLIVGYKFNDRTVLSVGGAVRVGLGKDWNNIRFTNEGFGLKSVFDWKLKNSIWMMGSYETNYYNRFDHPQYSSYVNPWQANILVGLMKKVKLNSKKHSTVRLAYNILYKENNFLCQPIAFKIGYGL